MLSLVRELWAFMRARKKYWLIPLVGMMLILGLMLVLAKGSAIAPFIYTLF
jgi:hypothetical protein